jgi:hypothetical protein
VTTIESNRSRIQTGGWSLIAATVLFAAVFSYLAAAFNYPDVLDGTAADVLPALLALGVKGRFVWVIYALIPLLLLPTGIGVDAAARSHAPAIGRLAKWLAVASAVAMLIGLIRWSTLQWTLAEQWITASVADRSSLAITFAQANLYMGNVIGEFFGELFLNGFFLAAAIAIGGTGRRWLIAAGAVASGLGWIAMLRNLTDVVAPIAELNNLVLPIWMLTLGVALLQFNGNAIRGPR